MNDYPLERWQAVIAEAYAGIRALDDIHVRGAVEGAIAALDCGDLRVAEKRVGPGATTGARSGAASSPTPAGGAPDAVAAADR